MKTITVKTKLTSLVLAAGLAAAGSLGRLRAADVSFSGYRYTIPPSAGPFPVEGSFFDPDCWLGYAVPTSDDTARFGDPSVPPMTNGNGSRLPHTIYFGNFNFWDLFTGTQSFASGDAQTKDLLFFGGDWIFDLGSGNVPGGPTPAPGTGSYTVGESVEIGSSPSPATPATASLTVRHGTFTILANRCTDCGNLNIGCLVNRTGTLVLDGPDAAVISSNRVYVGAGGGTGRLEVRNGARFLCKDVGGSGDWGEQGQPENTVIIVNGPGSFLQGLYAVANGQISIEAGAVVSSVDLFNVVYLGFCNNGPPPGDLATATVTGPGSVWRDISTLELGATQVGNGQVQVLAGGRLESGDTWLGAASNSVGRVTVTGGGSTWTNRGNVAVGLGGVGTLTVTDQGQVATDTLELGHSAGASGTLSVSGAGGLACRNATLAGTPGAAGSAVLDSGGVLAVADSLEVGAGRNIASLNPQSGSLVLAGNTLRIGCRGYVDTGHDPRQNCLPCGWAGGRVVVGQADPSGVSNGVFWVADTGALQMDLDRANGASNTLIRADSVLLGGVWTVSNVGDALAAGDRFKLFDTTNLVNALAAMNLPALAAGLIWDTSRLTVDGTIMVVYDDGRPLVWQAPPPSVNGALGGTASFTASVAGTPPFTYQWQLNGADIPGANETTLTLGHLTPDQGGLYRLVVSNAAGTAISAASALSFVGLQMYPGLSISGVVGGTYRIDATTDLATNSWTTLANMVLPASPYVWVDVASQQNPRRFYRAVYVP